MKSTKKPESALAKMMKRKLEEKKAGKKFGILGKDLSNAYSSGEYVPPEVKRGGRNGSGKP